MNLKENNLDYKHEDFKKLLYETCDIILRTHQDLDDRLVYHNQSVKTIENLFAEDLPEAPSDPMVLLKKIEKDVIGNATFNIGPHFYSYVLSPSNHAGMAGEFINTLLNQNPSKWHLGASAVEIEKLVLNWIARFIGYPESSAGILVSGGSVANLTCLNAARNIKAGPDINQTGLFNRTPMIVYMSEQVHYCVDKALASLGVGTDHIRHIPVDRDFKIRLDLLEEEIKKDIAEGFQPFCIVGNAGTVNTGSIDPLYAMSDLCKKYDLWFHVDAAYGGPAAGTELVGEEFKGLELADSLALDPHKWLYVPIEAGCALVKDPTHLPATFSFLPEYLRADRSPNLGRMDLMEYGLQLTRSFRSLKIWMTFKALGAQKLRIAIEQDILKARYLADKLSGLGDFEVLCPAVLSITCFRYKPADVTEESSLNQLNNAMLAALESDGRVFVTGTNIEGKTAMRVCIINHRNQKRHLDFLIDVLQEISQQVVKQDSITM